MNPPQRQTVARVVYELVLKVSNFQLSSQDPCLEDKVVRLCNTQSKQTDFNITLFCLASQLAWISKWHLADSKICLTMMVALMALNVGLVVACRARSLDTLKQREQLCMASHVLHKLVQNVVTRYAVNRTASSSPFIALLDSSTFAQLVLLAFGLRLRFSTHVWSHAALIAVAASNNDAVCSAAWPHAPGLLCFGGLVLFETCCMLATVSAMVYTTEKTQSAVCADEKLRLWSRPFDALLPSGPAELLYSQLNRVDLDVMELCCSLGDTALHQVVSTLLEREGLNQALGVDRAKLGHFLRAVGEGYPASNPYHNQVHAVAVVHSMHLMLTRYGLREHILRRHTASPRAGHLAIFAAYLAAAVHDYQHTGVTNAFLVRTRSAKAAGHNGHSPNERHHLAASFQLLLRPENDFLSASPADLAAIRSLVAEVVLGTDLQQGCDALARMQATLALGAELSSEAAIALALRCADLGHTGYALRHHKSWVALLEEEFFRQGDMERRLGLAVSPCMDRRTGSGISRGQVNFLHSMAVPQLETFVAAFPAAAPMLAATLQNQRYWEHAAQALMLNRVESCAEE